MVHRRSINEYWMNLNLFDYAVMESTASDRHILYIRYSHICTRAEVVVVKMQNGPTSFGDGLQMKWLWSDCDCGSGLIVIVYFPRVQVKSEILLLLNHDE